LGSAFAERRVAEGFWKLNMPQTATANQGRLRRWALAALVAVVVSGSIGFAVWVGYRQLRADGLKNEAREAIDHRDFARALERLERCMDEQSADAETVFLAARTARRAGQFRKAEQFLKEAKHLGWVENALLLEHSLLRVQRGGLRAEEGFLLGCVHGGHPDSALILEILVPSYARGFDIAAAFELLARWEKLEPNNPVVYYTLGEIHEQLRNKAKAVEAFQEVLRITPDDAEARQKCGKLLLDDKRPDEALSQFEWLIQHFPQNRTARLGLARCKVALGELDQGQRLLDEVLREDPDEPDALAERGRVELTKGDPQAALPMLRRACEVVPNDPQLLYTLGLCLARSGQKEEADKCWQRQARVEEDLKRIYELKKEAVARPSDPKPRHEAGLILIRNGYAESGAVWLHTALHVDASYVPSHQSLADYYERIKDIPRAELHRRLAKEYSARQLGPGSHQD
jgi:tetratricopeptide (TPR) repeat protein